MYPVPYVFLVFGKEIDPQYERAIFFFKLGSCLATSTDRIKFSKDTWSGCCVNAPDGDAPNTDIVGFWLS